MQLRSPGKQPVSVPASTSLFVVLLELFDVVLLTFEPVSSLHAAINEKKKANKITRRMDVLLQGLRVSTWLVVVHASTESS